MVLLSSWGGMATSTCLPIDAGCCSVGRCLFFGWHRCFCISRCGFSGYSWKIEMSCVWSAGRCRAALQTPDSIFYPLLRAIRWAGANLGGSRTSSVLLQSQITSLRNGFGVPLPELGVESSYCHFPITHCPKETGHSQVYLDARGLVDSLGRLVSWGRGLQEKTWLDVRSALLRNVLPDNFCERTFGVRPLGVKLWEIPA